ncbi:MAG TPA: head GIN domain-containing protein [Flavisolibacter sp.]|nr:head GIN domain-containing protein [Flavisolibacter sp.]
MIRNSFFLFVILIIISSCDFLDGKPVDGNGKIVVEEITGKTFSGISVSGSINVTLQQDARNTARLETDENLLEYIDVYTEGDVLVVKAKEGFRLDPTDEITLYASAPVFREIRISGSSDLKSANKIINNEPLNVSVSGTGNMNLDVNVPRLTTKVSGSGSVVIKGHANTFDASISGAGEIKCFDLITDVASIDISGAANAEVTANQKLNIKVSGNGNVAYKGNPSVSQTISGAGNVKKVG